MFIVCNQKPSAALKALIARGNNPSSDMTARLVATSKQDFIESNKTDQAKVSDHSLKTHQVKVTQQIDSALIDPLVRRLDILENSVVQISNIAANSMSLQTAVKHDIAKIFEKLSRHKSSR